MTQQEREQMDALEREPELADKLIDEMDRAGRDYMRLRQVEAERDALRAEVQDACRQIDHWAKQANQANNEAWEYKRRADRRDRLEALLLKQRKAWEGLCRLDEVDGPLVDFAENRIAEIDAAREKGGAA